MNFDNFKAGFVSIIGKPNVGKSTLMNKLIGQKLSIVTAKPQTTRHNIKGFFNAENLQIIFLDTPGYLKPRYQLHDKMQMYIQNAIKNSDVIVFLTDINTFPTDYDSLILELINSSNKPTIYVVNKIDEIKDDELTVKKRTFDEMGKSFLYISAQNDEKFDEIFFNITELLPISPPLYNQEDLSDMPTKFFAQEIIREKIFLLLGEEVPYSSTVVIEKWTEEENRDVIQANIWVERTSQRIIILGKDGIKIGKIRKAAEEDIQKLTGRKAVLNLWVKVKKDWRKKIGALHEFGYK
ncbi:MAG: GTPase Era [Candidatus Cloacimonetes bacterium]|nr:GTPase Era [Candidatus Cloacimonadota bacterium]